MWPIETVTPLSAQRRMKAAELGHSGAQHNLGVLYLNGRGVEKNLTNAKTYLHVNVQSTAGFNSSIIGEPRMIGGRLKYRFGS